MKWRRSPRPVGSPDRQLVTPEGVTLAIRVASRGARVSGLILDLIIIGALIIATTIALFLMAGGVASVERLASSRTGAGYALQFLLVVWIVSLFLLRNAYFLFFELGPRGATPGKRLNGIRIAARDGGRLRAEMVIARNLLRDIELFLPLVFLSQAGFDSGLGWLAATGWLLIFMVFPLFNRDGLRAGDVIAGSWVLQAPRPRLGRALSLGASPDPVSATKSEDAPGPDPTQKYRFTEAQLAIYGEYELQTLERVLRDTRAAAIEPVYQAISAKIERNDGWNDERAWLEAYYTQLRARLEAGMRMGVRKADKHTD